MHRLVIISAILSIVCSAVSESGQDGTGKHSLEEESRNKTSSSPSNTITQQAQTPSPQTLSSSISPSECSDEQSHGKGNGASSCPSGVNCDQLGGDCVKCDFNCTCIYGRPVNITCKPKDNLDCNGKSTFTREITCRYCYQTMGWEHRCSGDDQCLPVSTPRDMYLSNCTVKSEVTCLGNRTFPKMLPCNWTSGYSWSIALILSITLGGFGADRFYLGHWQEGIGKLFSFGGLGVWTIMDVILIAIRYLGPEDGSLYI